MWINKKDYEYFKACERHNQSLIQRNINLKEGIEITNALENRRKSDARMKERKESHEYAKLCLEKAKYELDCGNAQNAKLLFAEYEENIDYRVEEDAKKDETKTDAFNEAAKPLMEWMGKNCNPHQTAIVDNMGAQLMSGEIGVPSPMAIKYREEKDGKS